MLLQRPTATREKRKVLFCLSVIAISIFVVYCQVLSFDFVWDDIPFLKENGFIKSLKNIPLFFVNGMPTLQAPIHYRPVTMTSLAIDYFIWKENPMGYHLTNLLLHLATSLLLFVLIRRLIRHDLPALLATLIFALHPAHCDGVCWIMARADLICGLFITAAFLAYLSKQNVLSFLLFSLALLAKEMAITFPFIILLYTGFVLKDRKTALRDVLIFLIPVMIYLLVRVLVLELPFGERQPFNLRFFTSWTLLVRYLKIVFFPFDLKLLYHGLPVFDSIAHFAVIASLISVISLLFLAYLFGKREPLIFFSVAFFFVALFPVSGLPSLIDVAMIADRYLYVPMIGLAIFFAKVISLGIKRLNEKVVYVIVIIVIFLLGALTFERKFLWENEFIFLTRMVDDAPYYHEAKAILSYQYIQMGDLDTAEKLAILALKIKPDYAEGLNMLGSIYLRKGNLMLAKEYFSKAIYYNPLHPEAHSNLAIVYAINKDYESAEKAFKTAIQLKPNFIKAYLNLARMYLEQKRFSEAEETIAKVLAIEDNEEARKILALIRENQGIR